MKQRLQAVSAIITAEQELHWTAEKGLEEYLPRCMEMGETTEIESVIE